MRIYRKPLPSVTNIQPPKRMDIWYAHLRETTEVLFTGMPVTVEQHSSETGELEDRAVEDLPGVRQGIFLPTTVWTRTEILQPRLCESRKECIGWNL